MKFTLLAIFAAATSALDASSFEAELLSLEFHDWAGEHGKEYDCEHEKALRFQVWLDNHGM